jgi:hypothetical protein
VSRPARVPDGLGATDAAEVLAPRIESRILIVRGQRVIVDADLARLYGVPTKRLNEQVKRNLERFPSDFMFRLSVAERAEVVADCDHLQALKYSKALPLVFTEHGAIQAANVLASPRAVEMGIYVVRAFVRLKQASTSHAELARRLAELEERTANLELGHDSLSRTARLEIQQLFDAVRALMAPPDPPKRPIGFITPQDKPKAGASKGSRASGRKPSNP